MKIADPEQQKRQIQREEEGEEGHGGAEGADQQDEGEDEPAHQIEAEFVHERVGVRRRQRVFDLKPAGGQDYAKGDPEAAVGGEGRGAEGVAYGHFPVMTPVQFNQTFS